MGALEATEMAARIAKAVKFLDEGAAAQRRLIVDEAGHSVIDRLRQVAESAPEDRVALILGHTGYVPQGTVVAGIQSGLFNRVVGVSFDRSSSPNRWLGDGLKELSARHGGRLEALNQSVVIAGDKEPTLPPNIIDAVYGMVPTGHTPVVFMIEGVARGFPNPPPGRRPLRGIDINAKTGTLRRITIKPQTPDTHRQTLDGMRLNVAVWRRLLADKGLFSPRSVGMSFTSRITLPFYEGIKAAKQGLLEDANAWMADDATQFGDYWINGEVANITPAITAIGMGLLYGTLSLQYRAMSCDTSKPAERGALALLAGMDRTFTHPWIDREGALIAFDRTERTVTPAILDMIGRIDRAMPQGDGVELDTAQTDALLTEHARFSSSWRDEFLAPLHWLQRELGEGEPPATPPVAPAPAAG